MPRPGVAGDWLEFHLLAEAKQTPHHCDTQTIHHYAHPCKDQDQACQASTTKTSHSTKHRIKPRTVLFMA